MWCNAVVERQNPAMVCSIRRGTQPKAVFLTVTLNHSTELPQYHCVLHLATIKCECRAREIAILNQHSGSHPSTRAFAVSNAAAFDSASVVLVLWQNHKLPYGSRCATLALVPVHSAKSTCIGIRVGANLRWLLY